MSLELQGTFLNLFANNTRNAPIPITFLRLIFEKTKERYECRQSIAAVEAILRDTKTGKVEVSTGTLSERIGWSLYTNEKRVKAWAEYSTQHLVELLNSVRNRILDFALALWKEAPSAGEAQKDDTSPSPEVNRVTQIFNTTVYGGAANLVGTASDSTITFNVGSKDFSSLERLLLQNGVSSQDVAELKTALESDSPPTAPETFGPKVASWMGTMVVKAASGGWGIGIGAAGNLLSQNCKVLRAVETLGEIFAQSATATTADSPPNHSDLR
jgi:hypothetical protein